MDPDLPGLVPAKHFHGAQAEEQTTGARVRTRVARAAMRSSTAVIAVTAIVGRRSLPRLLPPAP
jgi:hypothetical protein